MSDYLIPELERYGVAVRDRSEVAELHGADGELEAVTLLDGERLPFSFLFLFLFLFLGAVPCTGWLDDTVARDGKGFILTGADAGASGLLETSVPGIYAAGDVRAGSLKRCATAVVRARWSCASSTNVCRVFRPEGGAANYGQMRSPRGTASDLGESPDEDVQARTLRSPRDRRPALRRRRVKQLGRR
jgi:hypothetical protein